MPGATSAEELWSGSEWAERPPDEEANTNRGVWGPIVARLKENPGKARRFKGVGKSQANYLRKHHKVCATNQTVIQDDGTKRIDMWVWWEPGTVADVQEPADPSEFDTDLDEDEEPNRATETYGSEWHTGSAEGLGIRE